MFKPFVSLQIDIQNFALVTHAVPAERVRSHVPDRFRLQTFVRDGREMALVSANGFCNHQTHLSGLRHPAHDFDHPYSVLIGPSVRFTLFPPRPAW